MQSTPGRADAGNAIVEADELDRLKATIKLLAKLEEGEQSAREKGWLTADEVEAVLGL